MIVPHAAGENTTVVEATDRPVEVRLSDTLTFVSAAAFGFVRLSTNDTGVPPPNDEGVIFFVSVGGA